MGNNDGKYHYLGIDQADKQDYYGSFFSQWFTAHPKNSKIPKLASIEKTFKEAGYYRVDIDDKLSVIAFNTLYMNNRNIATKQGNEGQDQLDWLADTLSKANGRRFIITNHMYPGAKFSKKAK